jgi:major membrane immunogen (membrane-anchored lipoprotein)
MKYSLLSILVGSLLLTGCGGGGKDSSSSPALAPAPAPAQFNLKLTIEDGQYIRKLKALDDGFAFVGDKILGGTLNGIDWYSQKVEDYYVDVDGENLKYSAASYSQCPRSGMPITTDGGKTWVEAEKDATASCGIEGWIIRMKYSDGIWLRSHSHHGEFSSRSADGIKFDQIYSGTKNNEIYLPSTSYGLKQSGRTKGIYLFLILMIEVMIILQVVL